MNLLALLFGNQTEMPAARFGQSSPSVPFADLLRAIGARQSEAPLIDATALQPNAPASFESGEIAAPVLPGDEAAAAIADEAAGEAAGEVAGEFAGEVAGESAGDGTGEVARDPAPDPVTVLEVAEAEEQADGEEGANRTGRRDRDGSAESQVRAAGEDGEENALGSTGGDRDREDAVRESGVRQRTIDDAEDEVREDAPRVIDIDDGEASERSVHDRSAHEPPDDAGAEIPSGEWTDSEGETTESAHEPRESAGDVASEPDDTTHDVRESITEALDFTPGVLAPDEADSVVPAGTGVTAKRAEIPLTAAAIATKTDSTATAVEPETPFTIVRGEESADAANRAPGENRVTRDDATRAVVPDRATRGRTADASGGQTAASPERRHHAGRFTHTSLHGTGGEALEARVARILDGIPANAVSNRAAASGAGFVDGTTNTAADPAAVAYAANPNAAGTQAAGQAGTQAGPQIDAHAAATLRSTDEPLHYSSARLGTTAATLEAPVVPLRETASGAPGAANAEPATALTAAGTIAGAGAGTGAGTGTSGDPAGNQAAGNRAEENAAGQAATGGPAPGRTAAASDSDRAAEQPRRESAFETIAARNAANPDAARDAAHSESASARAHDTNVSGLGFVAPDALAEETRTADSVLEALAPVGTLAARAAGSAEAALRTRIVRAPLTQAVDQIARMVVTDQRNVTIQLTPADLGRIQGNIAVRNGRVTVQLEVDTESVQGVLQASVDQLQESLAREGMDLQTLAVTVSGQEGNGRAWQGPAREQRALPVREKSRKNSPKAEESGKNSERSLNLLI